MLTFGFTSKQVFVQYLLHENEFDVLENGPLGGTRFHMDGFTQRLVLLDTSQGFSEMAFCLVNNPVMDMCESVFILH